jgi:hypothetical protein
MSSRVMSGMARSVPWAVVGLLGLGLAARDAGDDGGAGQPRSREPGSDSEPGAAALVELARRGARLSEQRHALENYLAARGISSETIAAVLRHTRDGIALRPAPRGARTGLGGQPLLPPGKSWPTAVRGHPFTFVAGFDFAELPRMDPLPHEGTLALYWSFYW